MGLPLSPILANVFLCYHETTWIDNCPKDFKPLLFKRYMDDTFAIFNRPQDVEKFLDYLNAQHPNMAFTHEKEVDRKLPFLDCLVSRENGQFSTSVFRKSTFTGLGLSFFSFISHIYKINSIKTLLFRAKTISSNHTVLNKEITFLVNYFWHNGYPKSLVYKVIKNFISKMQNPPPLIHTVAKQKFFVSLPFFGKHSERLKSEIIEIVGKIYPQIDFQVALVNGSSIGSLFPYKDRQPQALQSSIIYKFCCAHCASGTYIGSTIRASYMRIAEHRGRSFRTGKLLENPKKSSIREHALVCGSFSENDFTVLGHEKGETNLRILESLFILREKPSLNDMKSAFPLSIVR